MSRPSRRPLLIHHIAVGQKVLGDTHLAQTGQGLPGGHPGGEEQGLPGHDGRHRILGGRRSVQSVVLHHGNFLLVVEVRQSRRSKTGRSGRFEQGWETRAGRKKRAGDAVFRRFRRTLRRAFRVPLHGRGGYGAIFVFRDLGCRCPWNSPHFVLIWKGPEKERHAKLRRQSRVSLFSQNTWAAVRALASQGGEATLEPALHSTGPVQTSAGCLPSFCGSGPYPCGSLTYRVRGQYTTASNAVSRKFFFRFYVNISCILRKRGGVHSRFPAPYGASRRAPPFGGAAARSFRAYPRRHCSLRKICRRRGGGSVKKCRCFCAAPRRGGPRWAQTDSAPQSLFNRLRGYAPKRVSPLVQAGL